MDYLNKEGLAYLYSKLKSKFAPITSYPIGAVYQSTSSTSPATLFGGEWEAIAGGKIIRTVLYSDTSSENLDMYMWKRVG